ncbi:MAG: iron ABC transporter permease, partial [Sphingomonadales bacterium]
MSRFALPRWSLIAALSALALFAAVASLLFGAVDLSVARLVDAAIGSNDKVASIILFDLRLPRTILALAVGAMLGLA